MAQRQLESDEKRVHPRFLALSPALVVGAGGVCGQCLVEDLSASGARVSGATLLRIGERVRLLLQLPGRRPFSLQACVVRRLESTETNVASYGVVFDSRPSLGMDSAAETVANLRARQSNVQPVILVVDDSAATCHNLVRDLMQVGRQAIAVTTPLDAIEWLLDGGSHFDVALVDVLLNNASGCDLLSFLAEEYPEIRRVVMSDPMRGLQAEKAQRLAQPHGVLHKPWDHDTLMHALR
jgi:CheY-like chemotaxis protein